MFQNTATGLIWAENQVLLGAGEVLMAKECFEQWLWKLAAAEIWHLCQDKFLMPNSLLRIARISTRLSNFLELVQIIKLLLQKSIESIIHMA